MIVRKEVDLKEMVTISITCDRCGTVFPRTTENIYELQEFHYISFTGGYDSIFGDGTKVKCDICQTCLHMLIKDFMVTTVT